MFVPVGPRERELEQLVEHRLVGERRQAVVIGQEGETRLRLLALGDVEHHPLDQGRSAVGVFQHERAVLEPDHLPVRRDQPVFHRERLARLATRRIGLDRTGSVIRMQHRAPEVGVVEVGLGRDAQDVLDLRADVGGGHRLVRDVDVDDRGDLLDQSAVLRPSVAQADLRLDQLGLVHHDAEPVLGNAGSIADQDRLVADPHDRAAPVESAVLDPEGLAGRDRTIARGDDALSVVGVDTFVPAVVGVDPFGGLDAQQIVDPGAHVEDRRPRRDAIDVQHRREMVDQCPVAGSKIGCVGRRSFIERGREEARADRVGIRLSVVGMGHGTPGGLG